MQQFLELNSWGIIFLAVFGIAWLIQLFFFLNYFLPVGRTNDNDAPVSKRPVSVIIAARNEEKNLMEHIPLIMEQDYPEFELVVVNDSSWDDTQEILKALSVSYPNMHVINLDEEKQNMGGKKFALTLGIKAAKHDTILLTDADCRPLSKDWIRRMTASISDHKQIVLGFSPLVRYPGWLNKLIRYDTFLIGLHYLGFAKAGNPYMGVGRNLCYSRELFFRIGGFRNHYSIASGDDDLFVNQVANDRNTVIHIHPDSQTVSEPKKTWSDWFAQKKRHFTTAPLYQAQHKNMLALWPLSFVMMYTGFVGALVFNSLLLVVGSMLFLRYVLQVAILHRSSVRLGQGMDIVWLAPFLEFHLHALNVGLYITNLVRKPQKWN